ncbi:hypothetical protein FBEOM_3578 [Fusarium beomiforme]|uniref:Uncharacterized protein n=1 Tax=Fusarium beomiforme TaxID=44412 RepID=A0A9P5DYX2_9HYPO|nr:hypothetical protein FBEOM_3578 [Fusarium beomiforme]
MSSSRSSSPDTTSEANLPREVDISANPNSRAYAPDMDSLKTTTFGKARNYSRWKSAHFLTYRSFTYEGDELDTRNFSLEEFEEIPASMAVLENENAGNIHLFNTTARSVFLLSGSEFRELSQFLDFPPWISYGLDYNVLTGLGRRIYGSHYSNIWFTLPTVEAGSEAFTHPGQELRTLPIGSSESISHLYEDVGMLCLSFDIKTRQARILYSIPGPINQRLKAVCEKAAELGAQDDPFTFLTCALSSVLQDQAQTAHAFSALISKMYFLRVEKNLQTLRSQAISFKTYQDTRIRRINVCLSTLSSLLSLRTDSAIKASTEAMTRLTEANREDSGRMNDIAIATKLDSEAMITIAKLTMLYLPPTFIATLFGMGIFNFDFENGKNGHLVMSNQWWLYIVFAIPLTLGTFYWFRAVTRSHKQASRKAEREAKQPE